MPHSSNSLSPVSSTAILHSSNNAHKEELLQKIGGSAVLHAAVDDFYTRLTADPRLKPFFAHANMAVLKWHQFNIVSIAFTATPASYNVTDFVLTRHKKLFDAGLNETHYDIVLEHFDDTFKALNVDPAVIAQAKAVVIPLREAFAAGAAEAKMRAQAAERQRTLQWVAAATALVSITFIMLSNRPRSIRK